jgi:hypothetical protein
MVRACFLMIFYLFNFSFCRWQARGSGEKGLPSLV